MLGTDLETPVLTTLSLPVKRSALVRSLYFPAILIASCAVFGVTQCSAQDVTEGARQERAQKESKQKKSKHVYTEQDLKRAQILTPEDRAQVEAKKNQPAPSSVEKSPEAVDAQSLAPDAPLGDVARRFRKQKQSQKLQQSAEFHLPFAEASGDAAASAGCESCSAALRSVPAAGEALAVRAPSRFCCAAERLAVASASHSSTASAAGRFCSRSDRARGACRSSGAERRGETQRSSREARRLAMENCAAKFGQGTPLARSASRKSGHR